MHKRKPLWQQWQFRDDDDDDDNEEDDDDDNYVDDDDDDNEDEDDDIEETFMAHFFKIMKVIKAMTLGILMIMMMTSHWPTCFCFQLDVPSATTIVCMNVLWNETLMCHFRSVCFYNCKVFMVSRNNRGANFCNYSFTNQIQCQYKPAFSGKCKSIICSKTGAPCILSILIKTNPVWYFHSNILFSSLILNLSAQRHEILVQGRLNQSSPKSGPIEN